MVLEREFPGLGTNGPQMLVWGFFISTVVNYHATYTINSLSHVFGRRRFATRDTSRNNWLLAIITLGEGWHNNHHHFSASARQGFYWWEIDVTYYVLKMMSWVRLVWDLKPVPPQALTRGRIDGPAARRDRCGQASRGETGMPRFTREAYWRGSVTFGTDTSASSRAVMTATTSG